MSGQLKHHYSSMLKDNPNHFGHSSTRPPRPNVTNKWASVRDLDDLFAAFGRTEGGSKIIDLAGNGIEKLLGGGKISNAYTVKVDKFTASAAEKVKRAGGEVLTRDG